MFGLGKKKEEAATRIFDAKRVGGIGEYTEKEWCDGEEVNTIFMAPNERTFLVVRPKTIEVRCDGKLSKLLTESYETVMKSRYFGRGGIEIIPSGQLETEQIEDLVRLSYNLSKEIED